MFIDKGVNKEDVVCVYIYMNDGILSYAVLSCSVVSDSFQVYGLHAVRLLCAWEFSRPEYWSGLPCPPPGESS